MHHVLELVGDRRVEGRLAGSQRVQVHVDHLVLVRAWVDRAWVGVGAGEIGRGARHVAEQEHDVTIAVDAWLGLRAEIAVNHRVRPRLEDRCRAREVASDNPVGHVGLDEPVRVIGDQPQRRRGLKQLRGALIEDPEGFGVANRERCSGCERHERRRR
jgi:hypothetical protein